MIDHTFSDDGSGAASGGRRWVLTRRLLLKSSLASVAGLAAGPLSCASRSTTKDRQATVRFGLVTDCHYADADTAGTRCYRESLDKLRECVELMNHKGVDFLIELGDFKDQGTPPVEKDTLSYLEAVEKVFQGFNGPTYHVIGNHDADSISKNQFLARIENTNIDPGRSYYSFDIQGLHGIVLDANFRSDGADYDHGAFDWKDTNLPPAELAWLKEDLAATAGPVVVFTHQLLDGVGSVYVNNAAQVRPILEASGTVLAVFQGHHHEGSYRRIGGIHYYTLKALVEKSGPENNAYAIAEVFPDGSITVHGYRRAENRRLAPRVSFSR